MSKNIKILLNITSVLIIVTSLAYGTVVRQLAKWDNRAYSAWWNDNFFWANVWQFAVPVGIILLLIVINKKK